MVGVYPCRGLEGLAAAGKGRAKPPHRDIGLIFTLSQLLGHIYFLFFGVIGDQLIALNHALNTLTNVSETEMFGEYQMKMNIR